jgi:hypothetical protein
MSASKLRRRKGRKRITRYYTVELILIFILSVVVWVSAATKITEWDQGFKAGYCAAVAVYKLPNGLQLVQIGDETIRCDAPTQEKRKK